jgi:LmbE family N-acetylglucosaminyl deacetylase
MLISDIGQLHDVYDHVYLSPHLDDAPLSCGGAIARHAATDARVLVVTMCTAAPPPEGPFSELAQRLHQMWGLAPAEVVAARLVEDDLALERLSADTYRAGLSDAIYRLPEVYNDGESLAGAPAPGDPLLPALRELIAELRRRLPRAMFYAPLAIGEHVDHQVVHNAAGDVLGDGVAFYEDFPYVLREGALDRRLSKLGRKLVASTIAIDATLAARVASIEAYASQLGMLFDDPTATERRVGAYAASIAPAGSGYGERVWIPAERATGDDPA